ncbi:MAG: phosphatidate cytidylyltransferase [Bacteroidales bacterium]|nr:phosphatidate cytidylyltransferase [Bacteroidales bacterium]
MSDILKRTISGFIFIAIIIFSVLWNFYSFAAVIGIVMLAGVWEFYVLIQKNNIKPQKITGMLMAITIYSLFLPLYSCVNYNLVISVLVFLIAIVFIYELYENKNKDPFTNISSTLLGCVYIAVPFSLLVFISNPGTSGICYNYQIPLGFFILMWTYDTFAYLTGIYLGKHRLFERISPKKSWEGLIGGAIFVMAASYVVSLYLKYLSFHDWLVISIIVVVFGTFGDLVESAFKRQVDCKDSGNIMPGHGGILDRFDAAIFSVPFVYVYLRIFVF